eukprot:1855950-Pyramimonas_sp.AAC.1
MPRLPRPGGLQRIRPPPPAHPLWRRGDAAPATSWGPTAHRAPTPSAPPVASRKCHVCHAPRAYNA